MKRIFFVNTADKKDKTRRSFVGRGLAPGEDRPVFTAARTAWTNQLGGQLNG
jgi:hypothetical protein